VSTLLLPRLGAGNAVAFNNNFTVAKDGNPWGDGGADTFDGTTGVQVTAQNGWALIGGAAYTAPNGAIQRSNILAGGAVDIGVYAGWATDGIFACEIELGYPRDALDLRFWCNTGYDNGSPTGIVTQAFAIGPNAYELKTVWTTYGQRDSWSTTQETQLTVTVVPYLASQNLAGANPFSWSGSGDDRDYRLSNVQRGATMYIQWGKVNVEAVQRWIIGDLVESSEFAGAPHERLSIANTPPGARLADLSRWHSPNSDLWDRPGGYDVGFHALQYRQRSLYFAGRGVIAGTVKQKGLQAEVPVSRRVLLIDERAHVVVREAWSDAQTGAYRFEQLNPELRYQVIAYDHEHQYRAVVADSLRAQEGS